MNNKYFYLFMSFILVSQTSCIQQQGPSEKEIQERIDAAVQAALEEKSSFSCDTPMVSSGAENIRSSASPIKPNSSSPIGEYKFCDDYNEYTLIINNDETCKICSNEKTYYASWSVWCHKAYWIQTTEILYLILNGERNWWSPQIDLSLQWMYRTSTSLEAKDPNNRVKLTRVK